MSHPIVVVGSLNMDLIIHAQRHPHPGETLLGSGFATFPGGKGANQAVAAARLADLRSGLSSVAMVGKVGRDSFGETLRSGLKQAQVDDTYLLEDEHEPTGVALITIDAAGQNTIVVGPGANARLTPQDIQRAGSLFQPGGFLLVQLETPLETVLAAMELAAGRGMQVLLNPAPAAALSDEFFRLADIILPNQSELALLSGAGEVDAGMRALHAKGARSVIVTLGGDGARYSGPEGEFHVPALPVQVVDTTAAGDAFVGALAVALSEGKPVREAMIWSSAAGAMAVSRPGAQASLPYREEVVNLLAKHS